MHAGLSAVEVSPLWYRRQNSKTCSFIDEETLVLFTVNGMGITLLDCYLISILLDSPTCLVNIQIGCQPITLVGGMMETVG